MKQTIAAWAAWMACSAAYACLLDDPVSQGTFVDADHKKAIEADIKLGRSYADEISEQFKRTEKPGYQERVGRIGAELAAIANSTQVEVSWGDSRLNVFPYEFRVVQGEDVNAFSLPGGVIFVNEGLIDFAESDDELAGVLAHEIAHASFRHIAQMRRESRTTDAIQIPLILAAILTQSQEAMAAATAGQLIGQSFQSGWSLSAETSADLGGMQYVRQSRWSPLGMLTFMERLAYKERSRPQIDWGIYSTHPPSVQRAARILDVLKEQGVPVRRSQVTRAMSAESRPSDGGGIAVWFGERIIHTFRGGEAIERADAAADRLNDFFDTEPGLFDIAMDGDVVLGSGVPLFRVRDEDAFNDLSSADALTGAYKRMRSAAYELQFKLWPAAELLRYRGG